MKVVSNLGVPGILEDVLFCPEAPLNLLSVSRLRQAGLDIIFNNQGVQIKKGGKSIIIINGQENSFKIEFSVEKGLKPFKQAFSVASNDYKVWHERLGHISNFKFLELKNKQMINDFKQIQNVVPDNAKCEPCIKGKQARLPFNNSKNKAHIKRPLFHVHSDVCGPIPPVTHDNKNYFVFFLDEYTHYCVVYLITNKSDVFTVFKDFVAKSEAHFNLKINQFYIDNGREYLSNEMKEFCINKGISYHLTVPRTPQQNGMSERMVRTISEKARAMISGAKLDQMFWGEAVLTATYLINRTPTKSLKYNKTPYEMWHAKSLN